MVIIFLVFQQFWGLDIVANFSMLWAWREYAVVMDLYGVVFYLRYSDLFPICPICLTSSSKIELVFEDRRIALDVISILNWRDIEKTTEETSKRRLYSDLLDTNKKGWSNNKFWWPQFSRKIGIFGEREHYFFIIISYFFNSSPALSLFYPEILMCFWSEAQWEMNIIQKTSDWDALEMPQNRFASKYFE